MYWDEMVRSLVDMHHIKWRIKEDHTLNSQPRAAQLLKDNLQASFKASILNVKH